MAYKFVKLIIAIAVLLTLTNSVPAQEENGREHIRRNVEQIRLFKKLTISNSEIASVTILTGFYEQRNFRLAWTDPVSVDQLINALKEIYRDGLNPDDYHLPELQDLQLQINTGKLQDSRIMADFDMLYQAFLNLLINAIQAMQNGGTIFIKISSTGNAVTILIEDEGEGIPDNLTAKIWDPFFTTKEKGTGLGLVIVKNIIEAHGGSIELENRSAGGVRAKVKLPENQA